MATFFISTFLIALLLAHCVIWAFHKNVYPESLNQPFFYTLRKSAWALVAVAVAIAARWMLHHQEGNMWSRAAVALSPLVPAALYARTVLRWMRGLDELQQRIQLEALLFAMAMMGFIFMAIDLLQSAGCIEIIHWGWEGIYGLSFALWMFGSILANRRYQ